MIEHDGRCLCLREWAELTGISEDVIAYRHKHGERGDNLFRPVRQPIMVTIGEETKTLTEWAREHGVNPETARGRYHRGLPIDQVLTP